MIEQNLLFEEEDNQKIQKAVNRVIDAFNFSQHLGLGKLYVAFSGGKDSICVYGVCKLAAQQLGIELTELGDFHFHITTVDPPELMHFMWDNFPFLIMDKPKETMWKLIERKLMPPTRLVRYCCEEYKENGGFGRFCLTGVRRAESTARSTRGAFEEYGRRRDKGRILYEDQEEDRQLMEHCIPKRKYICNPVIDWTDEDVWTFIHTQNLPYCCLYDQGFDRIGCIGCPMAPKKERLAQFERWPGFKRAYIRAFDKMIAERKRRGKDTNWETGQEVFDWWISGEGITAKQKEMLFKEEV